MKYLNHERIVRDDGSQRVTTVVQPHERKIYYKKETSPALRKAILDRNQRLRRTFSGQGKGAEFMLSIPPYEAAMALKEYDLHNGSMEDRRREAERMAKEHPEWICYHKDARRAK